MTAVLVAMVLVVVSGDDGRPHVRTSSVVSKATVLFALTMMNEHSSLTHPRCRAQPAAKPQRWMNANFSNPRRNTQKLPQVQYEHQY